MKTAMTYVTGSVIALGLVMPQLVSTPIVIAHRGASGHRPEHTIAAYTLAIEMGADVIEPDLVITKDGVLIARHENEIGGTTDVAQKFPERKRTKTIDGSSVTGWFAEDLTLAEIRTLKARERLAFRSHAYDGQFGVPTFDEVLALAESQSKSRGRPIAVYPETKHPTYLRSIGLPLEDPLLDALRRHGLTSHASPVFIQSFEASSLQYMRPHTQARLVLLLQPPQNLTADGLATIRTFADGLGVDKRLVIPVDDNGRTQAPTTLIADAHRAGLFVHAWTLRREAQFLPTSYEGSLAAEARQFAALGVDGVFTDFPDIVINALRQPTR